MSRWEVSWLAAGVSLVAVVALVAGDSLQAARRRPLRGSGAGAARPATRPEQAGSGATAGPMLVRLERPLPWWARLRAAVGTLVVAAAVGLTLAIGLGALLALLAYLLRQTAG